MPKMPPRPCTAPRCNEYATTRGYCDEHQKERKAKQWDHGGKNSSQRGYGSAWRKLRKQVLDRDSHLCQHCLKEGVYKSGNQCDHIKPKSEGGTDDLSNLQCLCEACHKAKSLREAAKARL